MSSGESDAYDLLKKFCLHSNTVDHFDNPRRFRCLQCNTRFVDLGRGWEEDNFRGLAAEEVPKYKVSTH